MRIIDYLEPSQTVLELGDGAGWQAKMMAQQGLQEMAMDLEDSSYRSPRVWPLITCYGAHIALPNNSVDVVFSSNVLEHVSEMVDFSGNKHLRCRKDA
jgi:cyclopropane fatty-acyl-phospholipid synthase-like methyltransferase